MSHVDNINKLINRLESLKPELFVMSEFYGWKSECGTPACIAGWAYLEVKPRAAKTNLRNLTFEDIEGVAGPYLGITSLQAEQLFSMTTVPMSSAEITFFLKDHLKGGYPYNKFHFTYFDNLPARLRVLCGIEVLKILRDTGEVNWLEAIKQGVLLYNKEQE